MNVQRILVSVFAALTALLPSACTPSLIDDLGGDGGVPVDPGEPPPPPKPPENDPPPVDDPEDDPPPVETPPIDDPPIPEEPPEPEAIAVLEIHAMDLWAQYLMDDNATLEVLVDGMPVDGEAPLAQISLLDASLVTARLSAPNHEPMEVSVGFTGAGGLGALILDDDGGALGHAGVAMSHDLEEAIPGRPAIPVHRLYLGLRHKWFSASGRPARHGNSVRLFLDGQEAWTHVTPALRAAKKSILIATWFFESDFELVRDGNPSASESARRANTILSILDGTSAVKRVLVGQFWRQDGTLSNLTSDDAIRAKGQAAGDKFEYLGQANETFGKFVIGVEPFSFEARIRDQHPLAAARDFDTLDEIQPTTAEYDVDLTKGPADVEMQLASNHQKFMVIDDDTAFVGGMNLKAADWDTSQHLVFDQRRMSFEATSADRQEVADREALPENGPRKDYMMQIVGPAAQDVADVFKRRWDLAIHDRVTYHQNASTFSVARGGSWFGDTQVQVTTTMPDPVAEHSIWETWVNAVSQAETYIFIEDQYFRAPLLNDAILRRMRARPALKLVVVTKPVSEWTDPGCEWTARSYHALVGELGTARVKFLQLRAFDTQVTWGIDETEARFVDIDVHSKMLIVDDVFMSVGSANKNNRGMLTEAEMNVALVDPVLVRSYRSRIIDNLAPNLNLAGQPFDVWWKKLDEVATWNDWVRAKWSYEGDDISLDGEALPSEYRPLGFVYGLSFRGADKCLVEGVGPDMT